MTETKGPELEKFQPKMLKTRGNFLVLITPEQAGKLLDRNTHNRKLNDAMVRRWAAEMTAGRWDPDASDLKFDTDGNLVDGQHRLQASVQSGVAFPTLIRTMVNPHAQARVDVGKPRSVADLFRLEGLGYANNLAAAVVLRRRYETNEAEGLRVSQRFHKTETLPPDAALEFLHAHPEHEKTAILANHMYQVAPGITRSIWFAFAAMAYTADETDFRRFADGWINGTTEGGAGDPQIALLRYAATAKPPRGTAVPMRNVSERHLLAIVRAWNAWRMNNPLDRIRVLDSDQLEPLV